MPHIITRLKVKDYDQWKARFLTEESRTFRRTHGNRGGRLFRNANDPQEILVLSEWDDVEKGRQLVQSNELRERQQQGGVVGPVELYVEVEDISG